jgi:hypothetical protein
VALVSVPSLSDKQSLDAVEHEERAAAVLEAAAGGKAAENGGGERRRTEGFAQGSNLAVHPAWAAAGD